jgi:cell division control protein 24
MDMFGRKTESVNGGLSVFTNTNASQVYPKSAGATAPSDFGKFPPPAKQFSSLYEQTMSMISKLYSIPDFEYYLFPDGIDALINDSAPVIDPIQILWHCFRLGAPLCHLFNQLEPKNILPVPDVSGLQNYTNVCKKSIFHFLIGIKDELGYEGDLLFTISELYNDDMNKLVKVISTVDIILNELKMRGLMPAKKNLPFSTSINSEVPTDNRSKAIAELLSTERKFVASMQDLMVLKINNRLFRNC